MKSFKRGRGPSMMGGVVAVCMAVFGLIWTITASNITKDPFGDMGGMAGFGDFGMSGTFSTVGSISPLFGVVFMVIAIVSAVYNFKNATGKNRYSEYDITESGEEPDPFNTRFGNNEDTFKRWTPNNNSSSRYCPYCGTKVENDFEFCNQCGRKLP